MLRLWLILFFSLPVIAHAQSASLRAGRKIQTQQGGAATPSSPLKKDPVSRLDSGALVCPTEQALQQHQAAVVAMLNGQDSSGARGCRTVRAMTPVSVLSRHGPASTEIRLPGPPEQTGWTDSAVRDGAAASR